MRKCFFLSAVLLSLTIPAFAHLNDGNETLSPVLIVSEVGSQGYKVISVSEPMKLKASEANIGFSVFRAFFNRLNKVAVSVTIAGNESLQKIVVIFDDSFELTKNWAEARSFKNLLINQNYQVLIRQTDGETVTRENGKTTLIVNGRLLITRRMDQIRQGGSQ